MRKIIKKLSATIQKNSPHPVTRRKEKFSRRKITIEDFKTDPAFLKTSHGFIPEIKPSNNTQVLSWLEGATGIPRRKHLISRLHKYDAHKLDLHYIWSLLMCARTCRQSRWQLLKRQTLPRILNFYNESIALPDERISDKVMERLSLYFGRWIVVNPHTMKKRRAKPELIEPQARLFAYFLQKRLFKDERSAVNEICDLLFDSNVVDEKPSSEEDKSTMTRIYRFIKRELGHPQ